MPIIAVGAAIYAGATIATVGVAAMSTMAVISAVGAIASGIGVVTGNKELTKIGGIVSLVGGVGAFAQGQGWIGADLAKDGAQGVAGSAAGAEGASTVAQAATPGVIDPSAAVAQNVAQAGAGGTGAATAAADIGSTVGGTGLAGQAASAGAFESALQTAGAAAPAVSGGALSMLGSVGEWMEKNKAVTSMLSNFIGGALDEKSDAETDLLKARAKNEQLQGSLVAQQAANGSAIPDLTGLKVDPNKNVFSKTTAPTYYNPKAVGLINAGK
jgi:hypothetical protein